MLLTLPSQISNTQYISYAWMMQNYVEPSTKGMKVLCKLLGNEGLVWAVSKGVELLSLWLAWCLEFSMMPSAEEKAGKVEY